MDICPREPSILFRNQYMQSLLRTNEMNGYYNGMKWERTERIRRQELHDES